MNLFKRKTARTQPPSTYEGGSIATRAGASGPVLANRATEFYRNNPKKVGAAALLGAVALLGFVKNRGLPRA